MRVFLIPIGCAGACGILAAGSRREEVLRQSESRFSSIFDQTIAGIAQTDLTGQVCAR